MKYPANAKSLQDLKERIEAIESSDTIDETLMDFSDLPTFGGGEPDSTEGVFSWDRTSLLIQSQDGWDIVPRCEQYS